MNILKITAVIGVVGLATYLGYKFVTADPPGYCRAQDRYIGDEEFLKATIAIFERYMNEDIVYPDGRTIKQKDSSAWHRKIDFDLKNPNCCLVQRKETHSVFNRMFGLQDIDIVVRLNPTTRSLPNLSSSAIKFQFDVCGNLWDSEIGLPDTAYRVITTRNIGE